MTTTVINIKDAPSNWKFDNAYVYIGRAGKGQSGEWGNPFIVTLTSTREDVISLYSRWLELKGLSFHESMYNRLHDKILVCFCKPLPCHGDIIADFLNNNYFGA